MAGEVTSRLRPPNPFVGPMVLRRQWRPSYLPRTEQQPASDTNFVMPTYPRQRGGRTGPSALRSRRGTYSPTATPLPIAGDMTITIAALAVDASGLETFTGTLTESITATASDLSGLETFSASLAESIAAPAIAASGLETFSASLTETIIAPAIAAAGLETFSGTIDESIAAPAMAFAALETFSGSIAQTFLGPSTDSAALETFSGSWSETISSPALEAAGDVFSGFIGPMEMVIGGVAVSITGIVVNPIPPPVPGDHGWWQPRPLRRISNRRRADPMGRSF
jgi:hypothetical protein